jgi:hypothetical protein
MVNTSTIYFENTSTIFFTHKTYSHIKRIIANKNNGLVHLPSLRRMINNFEHNHGLSKESNDLLKDYYALVNKLI